MKPTEDLMHDHQAVKIMLGIMSKIAVNLRTGQILADPEELGKVIDFLQIFADRCHHTKEEHVLFPALTDARKPNRPGPIDVMIYEHEQGRQYVREMASAVESLRAGDQSAASRASDAIEKYVDLMQNHIQKEDNVLFPLADRLLSEEKQQEIYAAFEHIEEAVVGHGVHERYHDLIHVLKVKYAV